MRYGLKPQGCSHPPLDSHSGQSGADFQSEHWHRPVVSPFWVYTAWFLFDCKKHQAECPIEITKFSANYTN